MRILVTGGAGYIGSVAVKRLIEEGHQVVVVDNLSKGIRRLVDPKATFYKLDLMENEKLSKIFKKHTFDTIMHFAAYKAAGESMENPKKYTNNIIGSANLLNEVVRHKVPQFIFSSTAAVYGEPEYLPIDENHPTKPTNYYGFTKLVTEQHLQWLSKIHGFQYIILRYFNVIGDGGLNYGDPENRSVIPMIIDTAIKKREVFEIFGTNYDTDDGTCVRDFVDINDLVEAHMKCLYLRTNEVINLGTKNGTSIYELINCIEKIIQNKLPIKRGARRKGDIIKSYASTKKAKEKIQWTASTSLKKTLEQNLKLKKH